MVKSFEPRITRFLCQCGPSIDYPTMLKDLTNGVNNCIFAARTLRTFSKAGFKELECDGIEEDIHSTSLYDIHHREGDRQETRTI